MLGFDLTGHCNTGGVLYSQRDRGWAGEEERESVRERESDNRA